MYGIDAHWIDVEVDMYSSGAARGSAGPQPFKPARSRHALFNSIPYGGSLTSRNGLRSPRKRVTAWAGRVAAEHAVLVAPVAADPEIAQP